MSKGVSEKKNPLTHDKITATHVLSGLLLYLMTDLYNKEFSTPEIMLPAFCFS